MPVPPGFAKKLGDILLSRIHDGSLQVPALPEVVARVERLLRDNTSDLKEASVLLERDPVLAAQLIAQANSAAVNPAQRVETVKRAIGLLGPVNVRKLLLTSVSRKLFQSQLPQVNEALRLLWDHSLAVAIYTQDLSGMLGCGSPEAAYLAGLLHDVGQAIVSIYLLEVERSIVARQPRGFLTFESWLEVIEMVHRPISAALVERWNLPTAVSEAISGCGEFDPSARKSIANLVCFADALAKQNGIAPGSFDHDQNKALLLIGRSLLGLDEETVERISVLGRSVVMQSRENEGE